MKLKLDENLPESLLTALAALGHDADNVRQEGLAGHSDPDVWAGKRGGRWWRRCGGQGLRTKELCGLSWYPIYAFLRRNGYDREDAQDFTQAFFAKVLAEATIEMANRVPNNWCGQLFSGIPASPGRRRDCGDSRFPDT